MILPGDFPPPPMTPWDWYQARERAARNGYLAVVQRAHHDYLTGAWPDRDAYNRVEQQAWLVYYAAGRAAWAEMTKALADLGKLPAPPPAGTHPYPVSTPPPGHVAPGELARRAVRLWELESKHGRNCFECGIPWRSPSPDCPGQVYDEHPAPAPAPAPAATESEE